MTDLRGGDDPRDSDAQKVAQLRELIPATGAGIYLDTAYRGPLPAETAAAMREADDWELRVGRAAEGREDDVVQRRWEARAVVAALIGADVDDIALASEPRLPAGIQLVPHVDPGTGAVVPPRDREGLVALDATLSAGVVALDVASLGADLVFIASDRWLLGPEGTAALWVGPRARSAGIEVHDAPLGRTQVLGLARSVGWLEMYVGLDWIYERTAALVRCVREQLASADGVEVVTPPDALAGVVVFRLPGWPVSDALDQVRRRVFAIIGTNDSADAIRASVAWFNTEEEIDRFCAAVADVARYTPETLPQRPTLLVH